MMVPGWLSLANYDTAGRLKGAVLANGTKRGYEYDARGYMRSLSHGTSSGTLLEYALKYDDVGNIVGRNGSIYEYDGANRLTAAREDYSYLSESVVATPLYVEGDVAGSRNLQEQEYSGGEVKLSFDGRAASIGVSFDEPRRVSSLTLTPEDRSALSGFNSESVRVYGSDSNKPGSYKLYAADVVLTPDGSSIIATLNDDTPKLMYVKLHCALDKRDEHLRAVEARIKGLASAILKVRYWAEHSEERYQYDRSGNRIKVTSVRGESSDTGPATTTTVSDYSYWENSDRIRIVSDGTERWAYVYDENGNLAEKGNSFTEAAGAILFSPDSGLYIRYTDQDRI